MYLMEEKTKNTIYKGYIMHFSQHQDLEVQAYMANIIGNDLSKRMKTTVKCMSAMIAKGLSGGKE